jgi:hypothetical protein
MPENNRVRVPGLTSTEGVEAIWEHANPTDEELFPEKLAVRVSPNDAGQVGRFRPAGSVGQNTTFRQKDKGKEPVSAETPVSA